MTEISYSTPLAALEAVVLDTETTGLDSRTARLVQIGAVRLAGGKVVSERYERLVNPGVPIPPASTRIHGIADADVADAPAFAAVAADLDSFIGTAIVVGHTIAYDLGILEKESRLAGRVWRRPRALDVRRLARLAAPSLAKYDLDNLCDWLGIEIAGRHTAIGDAEATARVFLTLVPKLRERNIRTLAEAEAASRELSEQEARASGALPLESVEDGGAAARALARVDSFAYSHRVRDVMTAPPLFSQGTDTLAAVMALLLARKASSTFVRLTASRIGIVTERDVLRAIGQQGAGALEQPVEAIARHPLQTIYEGAFVYRAIGRMERLNIRHLGVRNAAGEIVGAVTTRNLLRHRATTAIMLGDEIDSATDAPALASAWAKLPLMARSLLADGVDPRTIAAVVSSEIHILTRRAAQLAEASMAAEGRGAPPVQYTVLVLGSAGRGESLLAADQDNAIVYETGAADGPEDAFFAELGARMCRTLDEAGVPLCKGGVMARNRTWRMNLADWRATIDSWVRRQRPEDLLNVDIFFDAVPVHGDHALGETVWRHAYERGAGARDFLALLTETARKRESAFTLLGNLRGDEKGRIDLKKTGLLPVFTGARVLSIRHGVLERATPARLSGVAAKGIGSPSDIDKLIDAHRVILGAMLAQQLADIEAGVPPTPRVDPRRLSKSERAELSAALHAVALITDLVGEGRL